MKQTKLFRRAYWPWFGFVGLFAVIGTIMLVGSHAATPYVRIAASSGQLGCNATLQSDSTASGGSYVKFGGASCGGGGTGGTGGGGANMAVGINEAGQAYKSPPTDAPSIISAEGLTYDRLDWAGKGGDRLSQYSSKGIKLDILFSSAANGHECKVVPTDCPATGVVGVGDPATWAQFAVQSYAGYGCTLSTCPMIEVLNEPEGDYAWGPNANDQTNADAYAALVKETYSAFHKAYGASSPVVLSVYDQDSWGKAWWSSSYWSSNHLSPGSYTDGIILHPYGGSSNASTSKLGNRTNVANAHAYTNKPVYATEVGWPTYPNNLTAPTSNNHTGDSMQWPLDNSAGGNQGDQCDNVYNFVQWARGTGYVNAVFVFAYNDYGGGSNYAYGVLSPDPAHVIKPAYYSLGAVANNKPNPCPNPLTY
jgi:hypothetical protein